MSEQPIEHSEQAEPQDGASRLVPLAESIKYRRRAQTAEGRIRELEQSLADLQAQLERRNEELATAEAQRDEVHQQLGAAENRILAERLLGEAGVVDIEAASLLLAKRVDLSGEVDRESLAHNVEQLILDKPYLRAGPTAPLPPASAAAKPPRPSPAAQLAAAAERAAQTGDRKDVADYLRLRRRSAMAGAVRKT